MIIKNPNIAPGSQISVTFDGPQRSQRGAYYIIRTTAGVDVAILWSEKLDPSSGPGYDLTLSIDVLDVGVTVTTPDLLLIPDELAAGQYELCTLNTAVPACGSLTVTS